MGRKDPSLALGEEAMSCSIGMVYLPHDDFDHWLRLILLPFVLVQITYPLTGADKVAPFTMLAT